MHGGLRREVNECVSKRNLDTQSIVQEIWIKMIHEGTELNNLTKGFTISIPIILKRRR